MFPIERLNKIKNILTEKKQLDVSTLSSMLNVTEVTIRRDLEKLENENFLVRTHGGAVLIEENNDDNTLVSLEENASTSEHRKIIGQIASYFINDGDVIFIGPGSVSRYIARALKGKKNLTVVTNDLLVSIDIAVHAPEVKVICPGGELNPGDFQLYGRSTESAIKKLYFNIAFIDVDGVSIERGYTVSSMDKAYITSDVMSVSSTSIAVCDFTKFNLNSFVPIGPIHMFKTLISNEQTPEEYKEYFFKNGIQFFCTFDVYKGTTQRR
jgi:Transcriptional regulators of sugar metabolism